MYSLIRSRFETRRVLQGQATVVARSEEIPSVRHRQPPDPDRFPALDGYLCPCLHDLRGPLNPGCRWNRRRSEA